MVYEMKVQLETLNSSEVDLNGSLWYRRANGDPLADGVLKLTSTGHYGIKKK